MFSLRLNLSFRSLTLPKPIWWSPSISTPPLHPSMSSVPSSTGSSQACDLPQVLIFESYRAICCQLHWSCAAPWKWPASLGILLVRAASSFWGEKYAPPNGRNLSNWNRMRYSLDAWEKEAQLGPVVAIIILKAIKLLVSHGEWEILKNHWAVFILISYTILHNCFQKLISQDTSVLII